MCCAAAALAVPAAAHAEDAVSFSIGQPEGFDILAGEHDLLVDVYFEGAKRGVLRVSATSRALTVPDPDGLLRMLPSLEDKQQVASALSRRALPTNPDRICRATAGLGQCGRLEPDVVGFILDRDTLRLDVFVNPRFLAQHAVTRDKWLPLPDRALTIVDTISALAAGETGASELEYTAQNNLVVGRGTGRARAQFGVSRTTGAYVDTLALEVDRPGRRYLAGAIWAPGNDMLGRRKLLGLGVESQIDTRMDRELLVANPLVVYLDSRARVDVLRDGHLIHSGIYEAGNQQIDTGSMPDGSYAIDIRIQQSDGSKDELHQFFSKSRRIPSVGRTDFYAFAGLAVAGRESGSIEPSSNLVLRAGSVRRVAQGIAVEAALGATDDGATVQVAAVFITRVAQLRASGLSDFDGGIGGVVQIASSRASRLNFNFDIRRYSKSLAQQVVAPALAIGSAGTVTQASGIVSYGMGNARFLATAFYRRDRNGGAQYSVGPSLEWDILRSGPVVLTARSDATYTERGTAGFAGFSLRFVGARGTVTATAGYRRTTDAADLAGSGAAYSLGGSWTPSVLADVVSLSGQVEHQPGQTSAVASADYRGDLGLLAADLSTSSTKLGDKTQFSVGVQSTLAARRGQVSMAKATTQSFVFASVEGARPTDRFELLVNGQVVGTIEGARVLPVPLPTYRAYDLRIRATGNTLASYEAATKSVGLYPGTVAAATWRTAPIQIQFGQLLDPAGRPMANVSIFARSTWAETDADGFFQIETVAGADVMVLARDGATYALTLPRAPGDLASLGQIQCCRRDPVQMVAVTTHSSKPEE